MQTTLTNAIDVIKDTYDYETCKEIVDHGCQSGVCSQHIYYADTIRFFDEHEGEITDFVVDSAGSDFVGEVLAQHKGDLDAYKNDMTWAFIEFVAMDVVDNEYDQQRIEYELIESYMQPANNYAESLFDGKLKESVEDLMNLSVYNPPGSMNLNRYSHS